MITHKVIYNVKVKETNQLIEVVKYFKNSDAANAFFQEVKQISVLKPIIEILNKE